MLSTLANSRLVRWGFVLCAAVLGVAALARYWSGVRAAAVSLHPWPVAGALLAAVAGIGVSVLCWRVLLADLGSRLPVGAAARVFFLAQLGKYVPGSIWPFVAQVELGREHGVPRRRSAAAGLVTIALTLVVGLVISAVCLPFVSGDAVRRYWWLWVVAALLAGCLHPAVLNPLLGAALRLARRPPLEHALSWRGIGVAACWSALAWLAFGVHLWLLVRDLGATGGAFLTALGAFPLAWTVGFLVVIAPAGVGPREVALAAALAPVLDPGQVVLAVIVSRLMFTVGDLAWAGVGYVLGRRRPLAPRPRTSTSQTRAG